jgi:glyoxylase-like metal-dependent hydrolase (beta-lactamase superfamily II)
MPSRIGTPLRLGSIVIQPVSDGVLKDDPSAIFVDARPEQWQPAVPLDAQGRVELSLTCLLVEAAGRRILVDTGCGFVPDDDGVGHVTEGLATLGLTPADIDLVVVSHAHDDHIGGATTGVGDDLRLTYPSARYWLGRGDWDHFSPPEMVARRADLANKLLPLAKAERLDLADGEQEIAPGVRLLPLPGHTPGHMGVAFTSGQETGIYVGDMIHHVLQVEHPEWSPTFDVLPQMSRVTRQALLDRARREHSLVLAYHLPFPGIGHIGPRWEPGLDR